jgi:antitoxin VapB
MIDTHERPRDSKNLQTGHGQVVHLPEEFRMEGTEVRVRRIGRSILLQPMERRAEDIDAIFAEIDRIGGGEFLPEGRPEQPPMPPDEPGDMFD